MCEDFSTVGIWIPVTDLARARTFYSEVLGWKCMDSGTPSPLPGIRETCFFTKGNTLNGCFCVMDEARISHAADAADADRVSAHAVFAVKDIGETLGLVEKNGGHKHLGKSSMGPNMGFIARFTDSEGNLMGVYAFN